MATPTQSNATRQYRDLDLSFTAHPVTGDIIMKLGDEAVKAAVRNLVRSSFYDRPFHPEKGSGVSQYLFELNSSPLTAQYLKQAVEQVINNFEPRVSLTEVVVQIQNDLNAFQVIIEFFIKGNARPTVVTIFLERIR